MVPGNFNMLNVPFKSVGADGYMLNSEFTAKGMTASDDYNTADRMLFWNAENSGYESYWYFEGDPSDAAYPAGWYGFTSSEKFETDYPDGFSSTKPCWYLAVGTGTGSITFDKPF